jgi:HrpA-like RNA helicase
MPKEKRRSSRSPGRRKRSRSRSPRKHKESKRYDEKEPREKKQTTSKVNQEFSFEDYKKDLDVLFFTDRDVIKKSTPQYEEFWKFFNKYQIMRKRQGVTTWIPPKINPTNELGIPTVYHRSFMLNFGLNLPPPDKLLSRIPPVDYSERKSARPRLTREQLMEFHQIILLYLEFLQREKMVKLKKLRESQDKLPIAQFKDEIIKTVFEKQVIIIAGMFIFIIAIFLPS